MVDETSNRLSSTDANGNTTSYTYDAMDNVTKVQAADGTVVESTYTQKNYVSTIQMMDKTVIALDYDAMGRMTGITDANGNQTACVDIKGRKTQYTYDDLGNLTKITYPDGTCETFVYDANGNNSITDENGSETIINTTENHPFYVEGKGWVTASQLETGDKLHTKDGKIQVVKEVSVEKLDEPVKVYNLEVDEQHTYFVSRVGVLVHNDCTVEGGGHGANQHHKDTINAKIEELKKQDDVVAIWGNRALNTAGLKGRQQPDITVLRINAKNQKIYQIFEYASPSQANGTRGYRELDKKIQIMKTNNQSTDENLIIEFLDIFKWGDY